MASSNVLGQVDSCEVERESDGSDMDEEPNTLGASTGVKLRREHGLEEELGEQLDLEPKMRKCEVDDPNERTIDEKTYQLFPCQAPGCIEHFETIKKYEEHYHAKHWHVCSQCKKVWPTEFLLGLHVQECHDMFFKVKSEKQPMFECYLQICKQKFKTPEERFKHCVDDHKYPKVFLHSTSKKDKYPSSKPPKKKKAPKDKAQDKNEVSQSTEPMEEPMEPMGILKEVGSSESKKKNKQKSDSAVGQQQANPKNQSGAPKKSGIHIQFGHSTAARFVPKYKFGMPKQKEAKTDAQGGHEASEEAIDMGEVQTALENVTTDSIPSGAHDAYSMQENMMVEEK